MTDLNERLVEIEDTLERLRYEVDRPYRSAKRYRIFSVVLGLFLLSAIAIGFLGAVRIVKEANRIQSLRQSIEEDFGTVVRIREELKAANEMVLKEVWASIPGVLHKVEEDLAERLAQLKADVDRTVLKMQNESDSELEAFTAKLQEELDQLDLDIQQVRAIFRDISEAFSEVENDNLDLLTGRERQLLTMLARELDPKNPELNYRAAEWAFLFGDYKKAEELAGRTVRLRHTKPDLAKRAEDLKKQAKASVPAELKHESPGRTRVGPYGIFALHYYTLSTLVDSGYITVDEAQAILDKSKGTIRTNP